MKTTETFFKRIGVLALSLFVASASVCVLECRAIQQEKESHGCCPVSKKNSPKPTHHSETSVCSVSFLSDSGAVKIGHELRFDGISEAFVAQRFELVVFVAEEIDFGSDPVPKLLFESLRLLRSPPL